MRIAGPALLLACVLSACTGKGSTNTPDAAPNAASSVSPPEAENLAEPPQPHRPARTWSAAPPGFSVTMVRTRSDGTVLAVRTVGSSSCPFEVDEVVVEGTVLHVVDGAAGNGDRVCTADARPSRTSWPVPRSLVEPLRDAETAVLHLESGRSFGVPLLVGIE